jgi:hypothetical protein
MNTQTSKPGPGAEPAAQSMPKQRKKDVPATQSAFDRYAGEPVTKTGSYRVPVKVIAGIRKLTPVYGSQGRAIQVATEILVRLPRPVKLVTKKDDEQTRISYKLLPRTIELLDLLKAQYEDEALVFSACLTVLQQTL